VHNYPPLPTMPVLSATTLRRGATLTARSSFEDRGTVDGPWTYEYFWGDRTSTISTVARPGSLPAATHVYAAAGTYSMLVRMTDKDGRQGKTAVTTITVTP
jgi:hypothetical protein